MTESVLGGATVDKTYSYDAAGRLTDVWQGSALVAHYGYDAHGNRTHTEYPGQPAIVATFDAQDRIATYGNTSYTHAITGERLSATTAANGTTTYTYDTFGQLATVTLPDGTLIEYLYDTGGRRVAKKVDGAFEQRFLYGDALGPIALLGASGTVLDRYVYGTSPYAPDYLVRTSGPQAGTYRFVKDERGSIRLVVNAATGAIAQQLTYDAFGRVLTDTNPGFTPFGFTGGLLDPDTGLVRLGARDYDPETGRWTTQDPIGLSGGDTNLYAYVGNDPVNGIDPSGLAVGGNPAMDSALGGGILGSLGFDTFARGMSNYQQGMLELSNDATFNQGLKDIRQGICQMVAGGLQAIRAGRSAIALAAVASVVVRGGVQFRISDQKQAGHIAGTPQHKLRKSVSGKSTSTFLKSSEANDLTVDAWIHGRPLGRQGTLRLHDFGRPVGIGPNGGGYQTQVRAAMDSTGQLHGTPYGPIYDGPLPF